MKRAIGGVGRRRRGRGRRRSGCAARRGAALRCSALRCSTLLSAPNRRLLRFRPLGGRPKVRSTYLRYGRGKPLAPGPWCRSTPCLAGALLCDPSRGCWADWDGEGGEKRRRLCVNAAVGSGALAAPRLAARIHVFQRRMSIAKSTPEQCNAMRCHAWTRERPRREGGRGGARHWRRQASGRDGRGPCESARIRVRYSVPYTCEESFCDIMPGPNSRCHISNGILLQSIILRLVDPAILQSQNGTSLDQQHGWGPIGLRQACLSRPQPAICVPDIRRG